MALTTTQIQLVSFYIWSELLYTHLVSRKCHNVSSYEHWYYNIAHGRSTMRALRALSSAQVRTGRARTHSLRHSPRSGQRNLFRVPSVQDPLQIKESVYKKRFWRLLHIWRRVSNFAIHSKQKQKLIWRIMQKINMSILHICIIKKTVASFVFKTECYKSPKKYR